MVFSVPAAIGLVGLAFSLPPVGSVGLPGAGPTRLTGGSPFTALCERFDPQAGAEVEPSVAAAGDTVVVAFQQDRHVTRGAAAIGVRVSPDGGVSWRSVHLPEMTECTPVHRFASDPWVSIGPDGRIYLAALVGRERVTGGAVTTQVAITTSSDGGETWSVPARLSAGGNQFNDKPAVTADPYRRGFAYAVWDRQANVFMSRTGDGGRSWSPPRLIHAATRHSGSVSSTITVLPDGALLHTYFAYGHGGVRVETARSTDLGERWEPAVVADRLKLSRHLLRSGRPLVRGLPFSGTGPAVAGGAAYEAVVANDAIEVVASRDGGRSWSAPRIVVRDRLGVFDPALAGAPDGRLALTYYALAPGGRASLWSARSQDRVSWRTRRVTPPFDLHRAPREGRDAFLGDYSGLAAMPSGFAAAFAVAPPVAAKGASDVLVDLEG